MRLTIFLLGGETLRFKDVEALDRNQTTVEFDYTSESDDRRKRAVFFLVGIAGISTWIEE